MKFRPPITAGLDAVVPYKSLKLGSYVGFKKGKVQLESGSTEKAA